MKIFMSWRQRIKSRKGDNIATSSVASSGNSSINMQTAQLQHQLQTPDHQICGVNFSGRTRPVDHDEHPTADLPHSFNGNQSLQDMMCPIYSSDLLHYKRPIEKNSDAHTDVSTKDYDMDLLIYQYALQNAILSIGTLGGELLSKLAAEMENENIILDTVGAPLVDNNLLEVAKHEKYCAQLSTTQKPACEGGEEGSFLKEEIHVNGPTANSTSRSTDTVRLNKENLKGSISRIETNDEVQVEMLRPCNDDIEQDLKCAKSTIYSTFINATLQEELKKQQDIGHQSAYYGTNPIDYHNIEDNVGKNQHLLTLMSEELDVNEKVVNGGHGIMGNMDEGLLINNELDLLKSTTMEEFLKGLYMLEEVTQPETSDDEASKCRSAQGSMMGSNCSRSSKEVMDSSENAQGINMGSSSYAQGIMDSSSINAQGIMDSSISYQGMMGSSMCAQGMLRSSEHSSKNAEGLMRSSGSVIGSSPASAQEMMGCSILLSTSAKGIMDSPKNTQGIMGSSTYSSCAQGIMQGSSSYSAQEIMCSSSCRVKGIKGFDQASSALVNTKPKDINILIKDDEEDDDNMATHNNCLKLASTCNHHMDLKRLIVAVTPNYLAKHLLKRLKLGYRQMQMRQQDCNYQCKFYKLLRMLRIKQSRRASNIMKREVGPLPIEDHDVQKRENFDNADEQDRSSSSSLPNMIIATNENWISTDDEYVVLELEGNKQRNTSQN